MQPIRIKACSESDLRMLGNLARNIQRVLPVTQADIDAAAALGKGWVVWKVIEVNDPIDNLRGGTQLVIKQNSITPGQNVRRVLIVQGPGGETVVIGPSPSPLLLPDAIANSLSYVKAFGGTEQNGTPTPDAPVDIVSNNGAIKYSKNLLDMSTENIVLGKYINNSGAVLDSGPNFYNSKYIPVVGGETYTWSTSSSIGYFSVMEYDSGYVFKRRTLFGSSSSSPAGTSGTVTLRSDAAFVLIGSNMDSVDITLDRIAAVDWQFEKGSSATAYAPYVSDNGGIYTDGTAETIEDTIGNTATAETLLKVGDYQDEQEILSGAITRNVGVFVLDGTESWTYRNTQSGYATFQLSNPNLYDLAGTPHIICSHFADKGPVSSIYAVYQMGVGVALFKSAEYPTGRNMYLNIPTSVATDITTFKQWLAAQYAAGTPVIIIYPLATPTTESVTGQHLQVAAGDNTLEITQASLSGLELEAEYTKVA